MNFFSASDTECRCWRGPASTAPTSQAQGSKAPPVPRTPRGPKTHRPPCPSPPPRYWFSATHTHGRAAARLCTTTPPCSTCRTSMGSGANHAVTTRSAPRTCTRIKHTCTTHTYTCEHGRRRRTTGGKRVGSSHRGDRHHWIFSNFHPPTPPSPWLVVRDPASPCGRCAPLVGVRLAPAAAHPSCGCWVRVFVVCRLPV